MRKWKEAGERLFDGSSLLDDEGTCFPHIPIQPGECIFVGHNRKR
jgi:hypothetical protein